MCSALINISLHVCESSSYSTLATSTASPWHSKLGFTSRTMVFSVVQPSPSPPAAEILLTLAHQMSQCLATTGSGDAHQALSATWVPRHQRPLSTHARQCASTCVQLLAPPMCIASQQCHLWPPWRAHHILILFTLFNFLLPLVWTHLAYHWVYLSHKWQQF